MTLDALPDVELKGTILSIGQSYAENQGDVVYEVDVLLTDHDPAMRWGMTAEVKFETTIDLLLFSMRLSISRAQDWRDTEGMWRNMMSILPVLENNEPNQRTAATTTHQ